MKRVMKKFPKSIRKYIRKEKARIRRQILDTAGQSRQIAELLEKLKMSYTKNNNKLTTDNQRPTAIIRRKSSVVSRKSN